MPKLEKCQKDVLQQLGTSSNWEKLWCYTAACLKPWERIFVWTHNHREMCKEQLYKFQLTEEKVGTYWCHVRSADGDILAASCEVQCGQPKPSDQSIFNEMKMSIQTVVGKK